MRIIISKELEALERLAMPDELHISECKKAGIGLTEDYEVVKQALLELKSIKEANHSEALEAFGRITLHTEYDNDSHYDGLHFEDDCKLVDKALERLEQIDNANPSEAFECLEVLEQDIKDRTILAEDRQLKLCAIIKQALQRLEKYEQLYGSKPSGEVISRPALCEAIKRIFGSEEKFLDIIEEDIPYGYHYYKYDGEEIYIIDRYHNKYINWYKLTHVGRDFHTDMKTKEEVIAFLQRLHDDWLKENE